MTPIRFNQTSVHGALEALWDRAQEILDNLSLVNQSIASFRDEFMSRESDLEALVAQGTAATNALATEVAELRTSGNSAISRLRELVGTQATAIDALTAQVAALQGGAVSPEALAALQATTDTAVAAAAAAKADADASEAEWDAVAPPAEPPVA